MNKKSLTFLRKLKIKNQINEDLYNKLHPVGQSGVLYGLAKAHKKLLMASLLFDQFFGITTYKITNFFVPILKDKKCDKKLCVSNLDRDRFEKLLRLATTESFFIFDKTSYKQLDGVVMGSPLGPIWLIHFYAIM